MANMVRATKKQAQFEESEYTATLVSIETREGKRGPYFLWKFAITCEGRTSHVYGFTPTYFTQNARARAWATAINGSEIRNGDYFDLDDLKGKKCNVDLGIRELPDGSTENVIDGVYPWDGEYND